MTAPDSRPIPHDHTTRVPGCHRCETSADEAARVADSRSIHDVIAEAIGRAMVLRTSPAEIAAAVVAACQQATAWQQAELIDGEVVFGAHLGVDVAQAVGHPREDPS